MAGFDVLLIYELTMKTWPLKILIVILPLSRYTNVMCLYYWL